MLEHKEGTLFVCEDAKEEKEEKTEADKEVN